MSLTQSEKAARFRALHEGDTISPYEVVMTIEGAGPPIGMTDYQQGIPVRGEYTFRTDTWHSIELNVMHKVPEWNGQAVRFALEDESASVRRRAAEPPDHG